VNDCGLPHPEIDIARRISLLESRAPADVMVWKPTTSATGKWEATGEGWEIIEDNPSVFADKLAQRITRRPGE
jgi:hypothetical protein